jgi:hypothetical protein
MSPAAIVLLSFVAIVIAIVMWKRRQIKAEALAEAKAIEQSLANYAKSGEEKIASALRGAADRIEKL